MHYNLLRRSRNRRGPPPKVTNLPQKPEENRDWSKNDHSWEDVQYKPSDLPFPASNLTWDANSTHLDRTQDAWCTCAHLPAAKLATPVPTGPFPFEKLPYDIRHLIYQAAIHPSHGVISSNWYSPHLYHSLINTSRLTRAEAPRVLYSETIWLLESGYYEPGYVCIAERILQRMGHHNRSLLRRVSINWTRWFYGGGREYGGAMYAHKSLNEVFERASQGADGPRLPWLAILPKIQAEKERLLGEHEERVVRTLKLLEGVELVDLTLTLPGVVRLPEDWEESDLASHRKNWFCTYQTFLSRPSILAALRKIKVSGKLVLGYSVDFEELETLAREMGARELVVRYQVDSDWGECSRQVGWDGRRKGLEERGWVLDMGATWEVPCFPPRWDKGVWGDVREAGMWVSKVGRSGLVVRDGAVV